MKRLLGITFALFLVSGGIAGGQMMGNTIVDDHTVQEEAEGKEIWEKLQSKAVSCGDLTDNDFGALGEYFMGQMMDEAHSAMNQMMIQVHGEEGEEKIHVAMGKRLSGCDPNATFSGGTMGWMPMMQMMGGGTMGGSGNSMMGGYNMMNWAGGSWLATFVWIVWTIVGILAAIWLWQQINKK